MSTVTQNMEPENGQRSGSDTLLVLQPKSFRSFNNKDEYLIAMKEDLADWFTCLYKIEINGDIFFEVIETGILLCKHANEVINFTKERREKGIEIVMKSYFVTSIPENLIQYKENNVKPGSFLARDNISNFISWCRILGIPDDLRFETEDLVTRKNEKSVILCLLEVARVGAKLGMLAPTIVQMEEEIDAELAGEPPPQIITCDLKSLDEMVRLLVGYCTCPIQFAMVKVGDGKYQVGESKTLIFVRILRKHVMVRVGGGWDTLERYLDKHDPCRCHVHRGSGQNGISASQKTPRRMSAPNGGVPSPVNTPRRMSSTNSSVNSRSQSANSGRKSPGPGYRSKSPSPGVQRVPQLSTIPQHDETSQDSPRSQLSRRSLSPAPTRSHSPGPRSIPTPVKSRTLPQTPGQKTIMARRPSAGTVSPSSNKTNSNTRSSTPRRILNKTPRRQTSIDSQESDNMEMENGDKVSLDEIKTMTLEDFKNLLNSNLAPNGITSQSSESPRSQESADSYRNQTKSIVRHGKDTEKGPSWKSVREKTKNVCDSVTTRNYQRNVSNNRDTTDSHNNENSRPKTPTSNWRPKTPTSGIKSVYARSQTPTSRPKTPSRDNGNSRPSPARSNEEDFSNRYVRSRTPSKASSFSSLDDDESSELAFINSCAASRSSKESSPAESIEKLMMPVDLRSRTSGMSGIPRSSTPSGIPKAVSAASSKPSTPKMARKKSLTDTAISGQSSSTISRPPGMSERTYSSIYQARRSKTPNPNPEKSHIPGPNRSITPGPREGWNKSQLPRQNSNDGERRTSRASRSLDFSRQRSKSVVDISNNDDSEEQCSTPTNGDVTSQDSRSRLKSKIIAMNENRRRSTSSGPKTFSRTDSGEENQLLMITRGKGGGHSVTVENKGATTYQSNKTSTPKPNLTNGHAEKYRQRSKTPDPGMYNGRTRLIDPKLSARRNSSGTSAVDKRLEAWVDSTVSQTKRKIPFKSKRSMTPNSVEFTDEDLAPRPLEEIKAALEKPMNGVRPVEELPPPPEDPEMFMKMEKLFAKYREMELQASDSQTPEMCSLDVDVGDEMCTNESTSVSFKSNSSPSAQSHIYSWTNSASSRSSGSPAPGVSSGKVGSITSKTPSTTSSSNPAEVEHSDLSSSTALVFKMKEVLKVRPRNEPRSGPRTRIPAPSFKARPNQRSKSITDLNTNCDYSLSNDSKTEFDSAYEHSVHDNSEHSDEISELSQMTTKFCEDSALELSRSETPVPKLATPLTTGRSTVISTNNNNSTSRLVRGTSQEPVDHSRSNSLSSLSSRLSLSNADDMEYV